MSKIEEGLSLGDKGKEGWKLILARKTTRYDIAIIKLLSVNCTELNKYI